VVILKSKVFIGISVLALIIIGIIVLIPIQQIITPAIKNETPGSVDRLISGSNEIAGKVSHNLILNTPTKTTTNTVLVYKVVPPIVNKEITLTYAKKFNVTGTLRGETTVQSKNLRYIVTVIKNSGTVMYEDQNRPNSVEDSLKTLPSEQEAIEIATKFLKDRDLFPEGAVEPFAEPEYHYNGEEKTCGQIAVWYSRYLNGMSVKGTQLVVYVGGNGDVIGYFANWRDYEPSSKYPVITPQTAFNNLKNQGVSVGPDNSDVEISIDNINLTYNTKPGLFAEDYLEPVWTFKGNVTVNGKPVKTVQKEIPALTEDAVKELSPN
jgi:hypothetical protein